MYQFAIVPVIGLGPLFILCLMFDQTKELFRRWLLYGIGIIFAKAMLSVVSAMVLSLSARLSVAAWVTKAISLTGILSANAEGLTSQAMQTGGIGLILTVLLISVPPRPQCSSTAPWASSTTPAHSTAQPDNHPHRKCRELMGCRH